jgi:hypothetical protein
MQEGNSDVLYDLLLPAVQQKDAIEAQAAEDAITALKGKRDDAPGGSASVAKVDAKDEPPKKRKAPTHRKPAAAAKKDAPKKKTTPTDETKKKSRRPLTGAAAMSAKKKHSAPSSPQQSSDADEPTGGRHPPGFSMVKAERDRIDRALTALRRRVATKAEKDKQKGKKPTTTVCSILNAALIKFYTKTRKDFETEFNDYLETDDENASTGSDGQGKKGPMSPK